MRLNAYQRIIVRLPNLRANFAAQFNPAFCQANSNSKSKIRFTFYQAIPIRNLKTKLPFTFSHENQNPKSKTGEQ